MKSLSLVRSFVVLALAAASSVAEGLPAERIRESEQKQEQLGAEAKQLIGALDVMLGEYERNNLAGEDVQTMRSLRGQIEMLTVAEMRQVVDLLQRARAIRDSGAAVKTVADAYSAQKQIIVVIQRILAAHARNQQALELARQLNDLADRQARNLQNGIELGRMTGGTRPENFEAVWQAQLETQRGEQAAIAAELKLATEKVRKFGADKENAGVAERFKTGAQQLDQVQPKADTATEALKLGQLFKAVTDEKASRDELRKVARAIAPQTRGAEALRQAERELAQLIQDQQQLLAETTQQKADTDLDKWIDQKLAEIDPNKTLEGRFRNLPREQLRTNKDLRAKFDAEQAAKATRLARLEDQQGEIAAKNDHLGQDLAEVPSAAAALQEATTKMQEARSAMQDANAPAAQQQQTGALGKMQAAHTELRKKADEAELLAAKSGNPVQDLERLKSAIQDLAAQEAAVAKETAPDKARQSEIARRAAQMAERTADLAPKAAPLMQQAVANAQKAEQALNANQPAPARQNAQQAAQQLAQAAQEIARELANSQAAQNQLEQAQAMLADLAKLIEAEQKLELETARATVNAEQKKAGAFQGLPEQQAAIERQTTDFKARLPGTMAGLVASLNDVEYAMQLAREELKKADGAKARTAEQAAIAKLFDAQKNANQLAQAAQEMLGQEFADAGKMAEAANQLAQALQNVDGAEQMLEQAAQQLGQQAAQNAAQAAQQAAQAARQAAQQAQGAQQQAQQAGNRPAAQQAGQAARQAQQAAMNAQQAAEAAQQMANQAGQQAMQSAQSAAQQAGQAAEAAQQAADAAEQAQQSAGGAPQAAQQAGQAAQSAQQAATAARQAQQMANAAARAAQAGGQQAGQSMQQAAQQLAQAAMKAAQATGSQLSPSAQQAAQQAAQQLAEAAAQAMNGRNASAQQAAQQAARELAQAAGLAAAQQAGISQPNAGQMPGQGQPMPGQGQPGAGKQPGQGQGSGPTQQASNQPSEGATGYKPGGAEAVQRAAREAALKKANFLGLPAREREVIQQSLGEKYPEEFGALVEQYLLNLANEAAKKQP